MLPTGAPTARGLRSVLPAVLLLVAVVSCGSDDATTPVTAQEAIRAGAAGAAEALGPTWTRPERPYLADATIAERCGDPLAGLGAPEDHLVGNANSPVLARAPEDVGGAYGNVRTAVLAYENGEAAAEAARRLDATAFERCLVDATNRYLDADSDDGFEPLPDATVDSFDTGGPGTSGDGATLTTATFEEELLGGSDNTHDVALFVARTGPFVVTALAASNRQVPDPGNPVSLAHRIGTSALAGVAG